MKQATPTLSRAAAKGATPRAGIRRPTASRRTMLLLPLALAGVLAAFAALPLSQASTRLSWSFLGAAAALGLFAAVVARLARGRALTYEVSLRPQHYLQACAQGSVMLYWGYYWRPVYEALPLLAAQLVFAYAFDMLLAWARRDDYTIGFAPFPVIFSTNLFLWFKPDWFYLQFAMIALGFAAKELIRWERGGRRVHIFNPSSFPLAVFSMGLILTGTTSMTYGEEIATTQFNPPNIYLMLFLIGLPGQYLFGVTTMTMSAVLTTYLWGLGYYLATGTYFFVDSYIPIAVFLGMHLLFTDPSTSPRTEIGRIVFGVVYGLGNVALYSLLGAAGVPRFYDKLLPVPLMNLSVRAIDRIAPRVLHAIDPARLATNLAGRPRHLAYMSVWAVAFVLLSATDGVGDHHPGHKIPFWADACSAGRAGGCETYGNILAKNCADGSGWACNSLGVLRAEGRISGGNAEADFIRACTMGFNGACTNRGAALAEGRPPRHYPPMKADYPLLLRTGKGDLPVQNSEALYTRACDDGFLAGCQDLAGLYILGKEVPRDPARGRGLLERACTGGVANACSNLGYMHYSGDGTPKDVAKGLAYLKQSCELGFPDACRWLQEHDAETRP